MTAPHRQKKHDRLTYGHPATKAEIECDFALGPLDRVATQMDQIWGVDRLVALQSPTVAAKYGARMAELNAAISACDPEAAAKVVSILIANLHRMNELALEAGHKPIIAELWEAEIDGFHFGILRDADAWPAARAQRPGLTIFNMREVANALKSYGDLVVAAKQAFPGAQVAAVRQRTELEESLDDEVPF